jgi:serine/threonine protein kinase
MYDIKSIVFSNEIYKFDDTVIYNGFYHDKPCVIKIVTNSPIYGIKHKILREICSLKKFNHPNIVKIFDVFYVSTTQINSVIIIYEKGIDNLSNIDTEYLNTYNTVKDITSGLKYLHKLGYIHGDLNMTNVAMFETQNKKKIFKLIDFGNCTKVYRTSAISMPTPQITPIEMLNYAKITNPIGIDSWALGCLTYYITTGTQLFIEETHEDLKEEVIKKFQICGKGTDGIKTQMLKHIDVKMTKTTSKLFNHNVNKRYSVLQFYKSIYKTTSKDKLNECDSKRESDFCFETTSEHPDRNKIFSVLMGINVENSLPIENIFLTFQLADNIISPQNYIIDKVILYTLTTKLICNSHFPNNSVLEMITKLSGDILDISDLNENVIRVLSQYNWNIDEKTLLSYIQEIKPQFKSEYIIIALYIISDHKYNNLSTSYKKELIKHILNIYNTIKTDSAKCKIKFSNYYRDINEIKSIIKLIQTNIDDEVFLNYFNAVGMSDAHRLIKLHLCNNISKFEVSMEC